MYKITNSDLFDKLYCLHHFGIKHQTREIFVVPFSENPEEAEVDHKMAEKFIQNLSILHSLSHNPILIHMITCGGSWEYGLAMYDAIKTSPCYITTLSYAHARSMSSIIIQAADRRILMPNCSFMVHSGTYTATSTVQAALSSTEQLKRENKDMLNIYAEKCLGAEQFKYRSIHQIVKYIDMKIKNKGDWFMSSEEAVEFGFADGIFGEDKFGSVEKLLED